MELLDSKKLPLSGDYNLKIAQNKFLNGETLSLSEKMIIGRDKTIKEIANYHFKSNCVYRAVNKETLITYLTNNKIFSGIGDEYQEMVNNKGIDWYLGGACLKYGDWIIECPASKEYFTLARDIGCGMAIDPLVRFVKSSGYVNPVPSSLITHIIDVKNLKIFEPSELIDCSSLIQKNNIKRF